MTDEKLVANLKSLPTSILSDSMGRVNAMMAEIKPITENISMAGPAVTVQCMVGNNTIIHRAIYVAQAGDILVIDAKGHKDTAIWGYIMTKAAMYRGIKGVIIDGSIRDVKENRETGFPIFCRGITPGGPHKGSGGNINVPIKCGGVAISPGDFVVGDDDGVVIVPKHATKGVLIDAKIRVKTEEKWLKGLEEGRTTSEVLGLEKE